MRRILLTAAAVVPVGLLAWAVAPALSSSPYVPEAVDFEQRLPEARKLPLSPAAPHRGDGHGHGDEGPVRFLTPPIEAPHEFDVVGLTRQMEPIEMRTRSGSEPWSRWVEVDSGDPVYAGGADRLQIRSRAGRPQGRLHYVNVSGTTSLGDRVLNGIRGTANSAFVSVAGALVGKAEADAPKPKVRTRRAWGANREQGGCKPRRRPAIGKVKAATVHHTVTTNRYSKNEVAGMILAICRFHRNGNGWDDIGYNFLVDRFGRAWAGRRGGQGRAVVGAHAQGFNDQTTGVAALGDYSNHGVNRRAKRGLIHLLAWKLSHHGVPAAGRTRLLSGGGSVNKHPTGKRVRVKRIFPHRRVNSTVCPGVVRKQLRQIRKRAQRRINRFEGQNQVRARGSGGARPAR